MSLAHITQFVRQVQAELRKVEWPSMHDFVGSTMIVFIIVAAFAIFLGALDKIISVVIEYIFSLAKSL